jgi:uncharacterized protein involved in outer membrane biogenesis
VTRKKRIAVAASILAGLLLAAVVTGIVLLRRAADPERLRSLAEKELSAALGQRVAISYLEFQILPTPRLTAKGIHVGPAGAPAPLSLDRLVVLPEVRPLFSRQLVIRRLDLVGLNVSMTHARSGKWLLPVSPPASGPPESGASARTQIRQIGLENGTLAVRDETLTSSQGQPLQIVLREVSGSWSAPAGAGTAKLAGKIQGGGSVELTFSRVGGVTIAGTAKDCPAATLRPLLWSTARLSPSSGRVDLTAEASGPDMKNLTTTVDARLDQFVSPGFGAASSAFAPPAVNARIAATIVQRGGVARISSLKAALPHTTASGAGTVDDSGTRLDLALPSLDPRDLEALLGLLGVAPVPGLSIEGRNSVSLKINVPAGSSPIVAKGEARSEKVKLSTLAVKSVVAPFRFSRGVLTLDPLVFEAYDGKVRGSVTLDLNRSPSAYTVETEVQGLDVNKALSANTSAKDFLLGTAQLSAQVQGAGFEAGALKRNLSGQADFLIRDGAVRNLPLLATINRALKITGGDSKDTKFEKLRGHLDIGSGVARATQLVLKAGEMRVVAQGDLRFDLTVDLKGLATFSEAKSKELFAAAGELRRFKNDQGLLELPLTVTGPIASPKVSVDLAGTLKKQLERDLKDQLLKQLLGE